MALKKTIAVSGLGGSGKSTQIKKLVENLRHDGRTVGVFAMRDYFLWPKLGLFFKGNDARSSTEQSPQATQANISYVFWIIRATFYFFDFWRVYFLARIKLHSCDLIIFDRHFEDFIVELNLTSRLNHTFLKKFLPNTTVQFLFVAKPETVHRRKKEAGLEFLNRQEAEYKQIFVSGKIFFINAECPEDLIFSKLCEFVKNYVIINSRSLYYKGFIIDKIIKDNAATFFEDKVFIMPSDILEYASYNRILWFVAEKLNSSEIFRSSATEKIVDDAEKAEALSSATFEFVKKKTQNHEVSFAKNDFSGAHIEGDVDLIFKSRNGFDKFVESIKSNVSTQIKIAGPDKFDAVIPGLKPLDIHLGMRFGNAKYIKDSDLHKISEGAMTAVSISAHAISELSMFNWGDFYKLSRLEKKYTDETVRWAEKNGWGIPFKKIVKILEYPETAGFKLPAFLSFWDLFISRVWLILRGRVPIPKIFSEFIMLLKCIRARNMGKIPFHDVYLIPRVSLSSDTL